MSSPDGQAQFTTGEIVAAVFTAWLVGFGTAAGVAIFASGKANWQGMAGAAISGAVTAAKDYRSLKRLPSVASESETKPN